MKIVVSIIIPYYNSMNYLSKLLQTIPQIPEIEVIVVNDHSTENKNIFADCKSKYKGENIRFLENDPGKKGAGAARNAGIDAANGEYLLFADSDDWFLPNMWESIGMSIMSEADIIYFPPTSQNERQEIDSRHIHYAELVRQYLTDSSYKNELRLRYLYWSPCSKLVKRDMVIRENIRYDEIQFSNDMMFSVKIGNAARRVEVSENVIYCILSHTGSLTTYKERKARLLREKVFCNYYFFLMRKLSKEERNLLGYNLRSDVTQYRKRITLGIYEIFCGKLENQ